MQIGGSFLGKGAFTWNPVPRDHALLLWALLVMSQSPWLTSPGEHEWVSNHSHYPSPGACEQQVAAAHNKPTGGPGSPCSFRKEKRNLRQGGWLTRTEPGGDRPSDGRMRLEVPHPRGKSRVWGCTALCVGFNFYKQGDVRQLEQNREMQRA